MTDNDYKNQLIELRKKLQAQFHVHPFIIFQDNLIDTLVEKKPKTIKELSELSGFPADGSRVKEYGKYIINVFKDPSEQKSFEDLLPKMDFFS